MRIKLKQLLYDRIMREVAPQSPLRFLKDVDLEDCLNTLISVVYLYTRMKKGSNKTVYLTEVIAAIGHGVLEISKRKRDSSLAAKVGAFFLYSLEQLELLQVQLGQGGKGHNAYIITVLNENGITELWESVPIEASDKLPSETAYAPWLTTRHETGMQMVKTGNREVLQKISAETHPILFTCLNKAQATGWRVNNEIFEIQQWALRNKTAAFRDIWEQRNPEAKTTKLREARAVGAMARRFLDKTFYHLYYYDFRGRKYPTTAYLHEQGTDLARGLLLRADSKEIGVAGFRWLLISIASTWGGDSGRDDGLKTDKIPLDARVDWANDNIEILLSYANSPKVNQGWMNADKPWQFLAACIELRNCFMEENPHQYHSSLECFIDGSNNGSQHLAALVRDDTTAPHVNLVPQELPGDLYQFVGIYVWDIVAQHVAELDINTKRRIESYIDTLIEYKRAITAAEHKSEQRAELIEELKEYKTENSDIENYAASVYWSRIHAAKERRKVMKRGVMTIPYGGTAYGLGQQVIDDAKKHGIELLLYMEHKWGAYMGRLIYEAARNSLPKPMQLLAIFEKAGKDAEAREEFLSWTVPITGFPVVQNYTQGRVKKIWVQYGPPLGPRLSTGYYQNTLQLNVSFMEDTIPSKGKQSRGASPNAIHSLDAAHLAMTVAKAPFNVTTIHDSYGCLLADMPELFQIVRETFVELYLVNPLEQLINDMHGDIHEVIYGSLDINLVKESEYCFV